MNGGGEKDRDEVGIICEVNFRIGVGSECCGVVWGGCENLKCVLVWSGLCFESL